MRTKAKKILLGEKGEHEWEWEKRKKKCPHLNYPEEWMGGGVEGKSRVVVQRKMEKMGEGRTRVCKVHSM